MLRPNIAHRIQWFCCPCYLISPSVYPFIQPCIARTMSDENVSSVGKALQALGDPSGRQDRQYWDDWFDVVCRKQSHRSFEWYCSATEVLRVIQYHLTHQVPLKDSHIQKLRRNTDICDYSMIHPGSGTSLLPLLLSQTFPMSRQVVIDISDVAISEIQHIHTIERGKKYNSDQTDESYGHIEYVIADLLNDSKMSGDGLETSTYYPESTFDCWIDKGFVDAIFSDKNGEKNELQSNFLFHEASRLLKSSVGFVVIVSLAEEHSLEIIIGNWLATNHWKSTINIWELEPSSGNIPPFAFVFTNAEKDSINTIAIEKLQMFFHRIDSDSIEEIEFSDRDNVVQKISVFISGVREQFLVSRSGKCIETDVPKLLATIEIKPCDADTDLVELGNRIRNHIWASNVDNRVISLQWNPFHSNGRVEWSNIVPIGFGISKLQLQCTITSDDLDNLVALLEEWDTEVIQSVDVDWSQTFPIHDVDKIIGHLLIK